MNHKTQDQPGSEELIDRIEAIIDSTTLFRRSAEGEAVGSLLKKVRESLARSAAPVPEIRYQAFEEAIAVCKADRAWRSVDGIRNIQRASSTRAASAVEPSAEKVAEADLVALAKQAGFTFNRPMSKPELPELLCGSVEAHGRLMRFAELAIAASRRTGDVPEAFIDFWQLMVEHGQFDGAHGYGVFYERHAKSLHRALLAVSAGQAADLSKQLRAAADRPTMPGRAPGSVLVHADLLRIAANEIESGSAGRGGQVAKRLSEEVVRQKAIAHANACNGSDFFEFDKQGLDAFAIDIMDSLAPNSAAATENLCDLEGIECNPEGYCRESLSRCRLAPSNSAAAPAEQLDEAAAYRLWRDCEISEDAWFMEHLSDYLPISRAPTAADWDAAMLRVMQDRASVAAEGASK